MKELKILIVDDEQPARKKIRNYLKNESVSSILEAGNGAEALKIINEMGPDLVFLDIQMPGMDGFELIEAVGVQSMPSVVFVTAYDQYALHAFEVQAVDYLLKPFDKDRFKKAFARAQEQILSGAQRYPSLLALLEEIRKEKRFLERIAVRKGSRIFFVQVKDIQYISAEEKYINIHTEKGTWLLREAIGHMESRLDPEQFARIHKSHIVNRDFVREIQPWAHGDSIVILKNSVQLPLSRRFRNRLLD